MKTLPRFLTLPAFLLALGTGCAASQPAVPKTAKVEAPNPPNPVSATTDDKIAETLDQDPASMSIPLPEAVMMRARMGLLPPPECFDTGWIRLNGDGDYPSSMTVLMECEQLFELGLIFYPGKSQEVLPDSQGRFALPYVDSYVMVKDGMPVIVFPHKGQELEGELAGNSEPRMFSIVGYRRAGYLTPIVD